MLSPDMVQRVCEGSTTTANSVYFDTKATIVTGVCIPGQCMLCISILDGELIINLTFRRHSRDAREISTVDLGPPGRVKRRDTL